MRKFWFVFLVAVGVLGLRAIYSDGYGKIKVTVTTIGQSPRQFLMPGDPNLQLLPTEKRDRKYSFLYTSDSWFEKNQEYLKARPEDAVLMTSSGGSEPTCQTIIFTNRPRPDQKFFRQ